MCSASATPPQGGVILNSLKGGSADTHSPVKSLDTGLNHSGMTGKTKPAGNPSLLSRQTLAPHSRFTPHQRAFGLAPSSYRQSLILQSANARSSLASNPPSSVGFDPQGGSESRTARLTSQLPLSLSGRDGPQSLPHRAGLTRARMGVFSSMRGGEKMKRSIRLGRKAQSSPPRGSLTFLSRY